MNQYPPEQWAELGLGCLVLLVATGTRPSATAGTMACDRVRVQTDKCIEGGDAVVTVVASHQRSLFAEGHQRGFIMTRFARNASTHGEKRGEV